MKVLFLQNDTWRVAEFDTNSGQVTPEDKTDFHDDSAKHYLVPGLVDCHCHGVANMDVMDAKVEEIGKELRKRGVEFYCPTVITAAWKDIRRALEACRPGFDGFAGVHLEGPFINPERAGAQPKDPIASPDYDALRDEIGDLLSLVKIITIAPELPGSIEVIEKLRDLNILVSAGHTNATYDQLNAAGIRRITHFYNAMRPFHHRDPGAVGYGLVNDVVLEIIYDRIHISREAMEIVLRSRGKTETILAVSDGTRLSGMPDGSKVEMWGQLVAKDAGAARCADGTLAGSAVTLAEVFRNIWQDFSPELAVKACSENPRRHLSLPPPSVWLLVDSSGNIIEVFEMDLVFA